MNGPFPNNSLMNSRNMCRCYCIVIFCAFLISRVQGNLGKSFLAMFPDDFKASASSYLIIVRASQRSTSGAITCPKRPDRLNISFSLDEPTVHYKRIELPPSILLKDSKKIEASGILIEADDDVIVIARITRDLNGKESSWGAAGMLLLPVSDLGTHYVASTSCWIGYCIIAISCTQRGTKVTIQLMVKSLRTLMPDQITYDGETYADGSVLAETLNAYDSMQLLGDRRDLTGTVINSNRPIAVISGGNFTKFEQSRKDAMYEQMPAVSQLGTDYVFGGIPNMDKYYVQVIFVCPDTRVQYDNEEQVDNIQMDSRGHLVRLLNSKPVILTSNKPVLAVVIYPAKELGGTKDIDPCNSVVMPYNRWGYLFQSFAFGGKTGHLVITTASDCDEDFLLSGTVLENLKWLSTRRFKYTTIKMPLKPSAFQIRNNRCLFGGYIVADLDTMSLAYPLGWIVQEQVITHDDVSLAYYDNSTSASNSIASARPSGLTTLYEMENSTPSVDKSSYENTLWEIENSTPSLDKSSQENTIWGIGNSTPSVDKSSQENTLWGIENSISSVDKSSQENTLWGIGNSISSVDKSSQENTIWGIGNSTPSLDKSSQENTLWGIENSISSVDKSSQESTFRETENSTPFPNESSQENNFWNVENSTLPFNESTPEKMPRDTENSTLAFSESTSNSTSFLTLSQNTSTMSPLKTTDKNSHLANDPSPFLCHCACPSSIDWISNLTSAEVEERKKSIVKELRIDKKTLSSSVHKKISAENKKTSSNYIGFPITVIVFSCVLGIFVIPDLISLLKRLCHQAHTVIV